MQIQNLAATVHRLHFAASVDLAAQPPARIHVVRADGRGTQAQIPAGWIAVCTCLSGTLQLEGAWYSAALEAGQAAAWTDGCVRVASPAFAWWLLLAAPAAHWPSSAGLCASSLLPWQGRCVEELQRIFVHIARRAADMQPEQLSAWLHMLVATLFDQQQADGACWLARCSGRTHQRKRQTLLRLLRVQGMIRNSPEERFDLGRLARSANYSPHHLIRIYRKVFGETPAEYAQRLRTKQAWALVRDTPAPICEITGQLGFESQSAFCRAFKQAFGMTTTQARRLQSMQPARLAPDAATQFPHQHKAA